MGIWVIAVVGIAAQVIAQRLVATGRTGAWTTLGAVYGVLIPLSLLTGEIDLLVSPLRMAIGVGAGLLLYGATQAFLTVARKWRAFRTDTDRLYEQRSVLPLSIELPLAAVIAGGEEIFWRGLLIAVLTPPLGVALAALVTLGGFVVMNGVAGSRPMVAGSIVGGALWTGLAIWPTAGIVAAIACHVTWTLLMIAFPLRAVGSEAGPQDGVLA